MRSPMVGLFKETSSVSQDKTSVAIVNELHVAK